MIFFKDKRKAYCIFNVIFSLALFFWAYDKRITSYNTTILSFSYKYGFTSRSLIGSIYRILQHITPFDMMDYIWALRFYQGVTATIFIIFLYLINKGIKNIEESCLDSLEVIAAFFLIFFIPMFSNKNNFGRVDIFLITFSALSAFLIIKERFLFLVPIFSALAVMTHQGFVFMYFNIILVLLFYRWQSLDKKNEDERKKRISYGINFFITFLTGSLLFLYFEFFSRGRGDEIIGDIVKNARLLTKDQDYHVTLIDHEILGIDLTTSEISFHLENALQLPIFLIFFLPFIIILIKILKGLFKDGIELRYLAVAAGGLTLLPNFILKVDFGRWIFALISYYLITLFSLFFLDERVRRSVSEEFNSIKKKSEYLPLFLLIYAFLFTPFMDVYINQWEKDVTDRIGNSFYERYRVSKDDFFIDYTEYNGADTPYLIIRYDILRQGGYEPSDLLNITFEDLIKISKDVYDVTGYSCVAVQGGKTDILNIMLRNEKGSFDPESEEVKYALSIYSRMKEENGILVTGKNYSKAYGEALRNGFAAGTINTKDVLDEIYIQSEDAGLWAILPCPVLYEGEDQMKEVDQEETEGEREAKLYLLQRIKDKKYSGTDTKREAFIAKEILESYER